MTEMNERTEGNLKIRQNRRKLDDEKFNELITIISINKGVA
jgi:hypothetical protein